MMNDTGVRFVNRAPAVAVVMKVQYLSKVVHVSFDKYCTFITTAMAGALFTNLTSMSLIIITFL